MEPNRFFFKLTAMFLQYFLLVLILLPFIYFSQLLKYNFNPEEIYFPKVLFLAIAIAMPFTVANAFAFAKFENMELVHYLKASQKHRVLIRENPAIILNRIKTNLAKRPFWTLTGETEHSLNYSIRSVILIDDLRVDFNLIEESLTEVKIQSRPRLAFIFLDYGRNYRNILHVLMAAKPN